MVHLKAWETFLLQNDLSMEFYTFFLLEQNIPTLALKAWSEFKKTLCLVAMGVRGTDFRKSFVDRDAPFLVWAVRLRNCSCHPSAEADSQQSNKKLLISCLWCSALPGVAPSVIANQCPPYKLTGRMEVNPLQERAISGHQWSAFSPHGGREQTWFGDLNSSS